MSWKLMILRENKFKSQNVLSVSNNSHMTKDQDLMHKVKQNQIDVSNIDLGLNLD